MLSIIMTTVKQWKKSVCPREKKSKVSGQCAKKVVSDSPGLVDFAIGLVISVLNLPNGQMKFLGGIQITEEL